MHAADLAHRLIGSGKALSPERFQKLARHINSRTHLEAVLNELPEDVREPVRDGVEPYLKRLGL